MKNKILFGIILIAVFINSMFLVYGFSDKNVKSVLKKSLFEYFDEGKDLTLTLDETKDLLVFYLESEHDVEDVNLDKIGDNSKQSVQAIISKALIGFEKEEEPDQNTCTVGYKCQTEFLKAYQNVDCSWSNAVFCEDGCMNGECKSPPLLSDCSEYGPDFWCGNYESWQGQCQSKGIKYEADCDTSRGGNEYCIRCTLCIDSDSGKNYYVKGSLDVGCPAGADCRVFNDHCKTANTLVENFCINDDPSEKLYNCSNGCSGGACIEEKLNCTDSDDGKNYYVYGSAKEGYSSSLDVCFKVEGGESTQVPYCTGPQCFLSEQYCSTEGRSTSRYLCPNGCQDGACIPVNCSTYGPGFWCGNYESWQVQCRSNGIKYEADCDGGKKGYGYCIRCRNCNDSDGGKVYHVKGVVQGIPTSLSNYDDFAEDYCDGNMLVEFYCSDAGEIYFEKIPCSNCSNDVCLDYIPKYGEPCSSNAECGDLLCKPSGRYGESEKYCCYENECASVISGIPFKNCVGEGGTDQRDYPPPAVTLTCKNGEWHEPDLINCSTIGPDFWCGTVSEFDIECNWNGTILYNTTCYTGLQERGHCMRCAPR